MSTLQTRKALAVEGFQLVASVTLQEAIDALFGDDAKGDKREGSAPRKSPEATRPVN